MEILSVSHAPAAVKHIDMRLTGDEALFLAKCLAYQFGRHSRANMPEGHLKTIYNSLRTALGCGGVLNGDTKRLAWVHSADDIDDNGFAKVNRNAAEINRLERKLAEQEQLIAKQYKLLDKRQAALQDIIDLARDAEGG